MNNIKELTTEEQIKTIVITLFNLGASFEHIAARIGYSINEVIAIVMADVILEGAEKEDLCTNKKALKTL